MFSILPHSHPAEPAEPIHKSKQNPYPEDYCESIKANWPNFPNKKHSLPGFPIPGSSHHIPGGSIKRERQCVELELATISRN
jgi:hypothetical protein